MVSTRQIERKGTLTAGVADLNASLANMKGDNFSHFASIFFFRFAEGESVTVAGKCRVGRTSKSI